MLSAPTAIPATIELTLPAGVHPGRGNRRIADVHRVGDQFLQPGVLGPLHDRDQAGARHQLLLVEPHRRPPPRLR